MTLFSLASSPAGLVFRVRGSFFFQGARDRRQFALKDALTLRTCTARFRRPSSRRNRVLYLPERALWLLDIAPREGRRRGARSREERGRGNVGTNIKRRKGETFCFFHFRPRRLKTAPAPRLSSPLPRRTIYFPFPSFSNLLRKPLRSFVVTFARPFRFERPRASFRVFEKQRSSSSLSFFFISPLSHHPPPPPPRPPTTLTHSPTHPSPPPKKKNQKTNKKTLSESRSPSTASCSSASSGAR